MPHPELPDAAKSDVLSVAIIGNDTVLAALPAHPVQLAHGCHLLGYHTVVPANWGDELVAEVVLREAEARGRRPAVVCACERARARLTTSGGELLPFLIPTVAPPVATARYLRQILPDKHLDVTFVGDCASGLDPVFDARYSPEVFLVRLRSAGIDLRELPTHFENLVPPDRRRHLSLPGGCPSPDALRRRCPGRKLVELTDSNLALDLADQLVAQEPVLLDVAAGVGCSCAGIRRSGSPRTARVAVMSLEPPRAAESVLDAESWLEVATAMGMSHGPGLLARDPAADVGQVVAAKEDFDLAAFDALSLPVDDETFAFVDTRDTSAEEVIASHMDETASLTAQIEPVGFDVALTDTQAVEDETEALEPAMSAATMGAGVDLAEAGGPSPRRPLAITPPRALRALTAREGFVVPRLDKASRTPFARPLVPPQAAATAPRSVTPAVESVAVPSMTAFRFPVAPPAPPPFLGGPRPPTPAPAPPVMTSEIRRVPPPAPQAPRLRRVLFWTIVALTIFTLAVLSASRGR